MINAILHVIITFHLENKNADEEMTIHRGWTSLL